MATLQQTTINGNSLWTTSNYNRFINRGNPGSSSPLTLSSFGDVHYYWINNSGTIDISTTMVENSVYEVHYHMFNSGSNCDPIINPNYTSYGGEFTGYYYGSPGLPTYFIQTLSGFYFDHLAGVEGSNPCGTFILFNQRSKKNVIYYGGDTSSVCYGTCRWNNNTTQWLNVGRLTGIPTATELKVFVRRIG
jgi:hypothetical protein